MNNKANTKTSVETVCRVVTAASFIGAGLLGTVGVVCNAIANRRDRKLLKMIYEYNHDYYNDYITRNKYDPFFEILEFATQAYRKRIQDYLDKYGYSTQV